MENANTYIVTVYTIYSILAVVLIAWLAITLFKNGAHFLTVVFRDNEVLAKAVNRLLVTGFIMFSLGFASLTVAGGNAYDAAEAFETSTKKFGLLLVVLAFAHFFNMLVLNNMRKSAEAKNERADRAGMKQSYDEAIAQYKEAIATQTAAQGTPQSPGSIA
jgi:hypothetical protein